MKSKILLKLVVILLLFIFSKTTLFASGYTFSGGTGVSADPYQIKTAKDLDSLRAYLGTTYTLTYFRMMNDIDLTSYISTNYPTSGWLPIGSYFNGFSASFNGGGYRIIGLTINRPSTNLNGFFGYINLDGKIDSVGIVTSSAGIVGYDSTGVLAGCNLGRITNSYTAGNLTGHSYVGGLTGLNNSAVPPGISTCYSTANVTGMGTGIGGLIGYHATGNVSTCYAAGKVTGGPVVGGFFGSFITGTVSSNYWDTGTTGQSVGYGSGLIFSGLTGKTTANMMTQSTFSGWNFTTTWVIKAGVSYPRFKNRTGTLVVSNTSNITETYGNPDHVLPGLAVGTPAIPSGYTYPIKYTMTANANLTLIVSGAQTSVHASIYTRSAVTIAASQPGDDYYFPSDTVTFTYLVNKGTPVLNWNTPANITYPQVLSGTQLNAATQNNESGTFIYTPASAAILKSGINKLKTVFTPTDTSYYSVSDSVNITVLKGSTSVTWSTPANITYTTLLSSTQLNAGEQNSHAGTFVYNPVTGTKLTSGNHTLNVNYTPTDSNYTSSTGSVVINVQKAFPNLTWNAPANITYPTTLSASQLNASEQSSLAGTFTYTPAMGSILNSGSQKLRVSFTATDTNYSTVKDSVTLTVLKGSTSVTWSTPGNITYPTLLSNTQLNAGEQNSHAGTFVYNPVTGTKLTSGNHTLNVNYTPTDTNYTSSTGSVVINVQKAFPNLTWNAPANIAYPTNLSASQLNASEQSSLAGTFTYTPAMGTILNSGSQKLKVSFTATDTNYSTVNDSVTLTVLKGSTSVTWSTPANITYTTLLSSTQLNAGEQNSHAGTFVYNPVTGTKLTSGNHTLNVNYTPTDSNYTSSTGSVVINVQKAFPNLTWNAPANITYPTTLSASQLNASEQSSLAGTFTYTPAMGSILNSGNQYLRVNFTATDTNYNHQVDSVMITVLKKHPTIIWNAPTDMVYPSALSGTQLNAAEQNSLAGSFTYNPPATTVLLPGAYRLKTIFTPADTNYITVSDSVLVNVKKRNPSLVWSTPSVIMYPTALSETQLNTTEQNNVSGTFTYSPLLGTILNSGKHSLYVTFIPTDTTYNTVSDSVIITVQKNNPVLIWSNPANIVYPIALNGTQLNAVEENGLEGVFTYFPSAGTVLTSGNHYLKTTFISTDTNYYPLTDSVSIMVQQNNPEVVWNTPDTITYPAPINGLQLNASEHNSLSGIFHYSTVSGTILPSGENYLHTSFIPTDTNYVTVNDSVLMYVKKGMSSIVWSSPAAIPYNTSLSAVQLNATEQNLLLGNFVYNPVPGTKLNAGENTLKTTFTPTDTNYTTVSDSVTIFVNKVNPTIIWNAPANITYQTPLSSTQLNATEHNSLSGTFIYKPAPGTILFSGTQYLYVQFTPTDTNYVTINDSVLIKVEKKIPVLSWNTPTAINYGTAISASQLNASEQGGVPGLFTYTPVSGTNLNSGSYKLKVNFVPTDTNYTPVLDSVTLQVDKVNPQIVWSNPADISYGTLLGSAQLNATEQNNLSGTFTYTPLAGISLQKGVHTLKVSFTPVDTNYNTIQDSVTLNVTNINPIVVWNTPVDIPYETVLSSIQLNAIEKNSLSGTFTYNPSSGKILDAGTHWLKVTFTPDDLVNYNIITDSVPITVTKLNPILNWNTPSDITYLTPLTIFQLNASEQNNVLGLYTYNHLLGTILPSGSQWLKVVFDPFDANYNSVSDSVMINVKKAGGFNLTWNPPSELEYGIALTESLFNLSIINALMQPLNAGTENTINKTPKENPGVQSTLLGTFNCTPPFGTVLNSGAHLITISFTPADTNFNIISDSVIINVAKKNPTVVWNPPANIAGGTVLSNTQLNASEQSGLAGVFTYIPAAGMALPVGTHTLKVIFTPTDTNYYSVYDSVTLTVNSNTQSIIWNITRNITYGHPLDSSVLNASIQNNTPGTYLYNPPAGTILPSGTQHLYVTFIPEDTSRAVLQDSVAITILKATPAIYWSAPSEIVYGTPLNTTQLNAIVGHGVDGNFSYKPTIGTVLPSGTYNLTVNFTPADSNYLPAQITTTLIVNKAVPVIKWDIPTHLTTGTTVDTSILNAIEQSQLAGTFIFDPPLGTVLTEGIYDFSVIFTPKDTNYITCYVTKIVNVSTQGITKTKKSTNQVIIFPNPLVVNQSLGIYMEDKAENVEWSIVDLSGKILLKGIILANSNMKISTVGLEEGIYFVCLKGKLWQKTKKLIIH